MTRRRISPDAPGSRARCKMGPRSDRGPRASQDVRDPRGVRRLCGASVGVGPPEARRQTSDWPARGTRRCRSLFSYTGSDLLRVGKGDGKFGMSTSPDRPRLDAVDHVSMAGTPRDLAPRPDPEKTLGRGLGPVGRRDMPGFARRPPRPRPRGPSTSRPRPRWRPGPDPEMPLKPRRRRPDILSGCRRRPNDMGLAPVPDVRLFPRPQFHLSLDDTWADDDPPPRMFT